MANYYTLNQLVHLTAAFTVSGTATDPTTVVCKVKDPSGAITTPSAVKDSTGNYHYDVAATISGRYYYRFEGTGTCQASAEAFFDVASQLTS